MLDTKVDFPKEKKEMVKETELTADQLKLWSHTTTLQISIHMESSYCRGCEPEGPGQHSKNLRQQLRFSKVTHED